MTRMDIVQWGIVGCGNVTEVKSGPGFQKADGSRLVAVMRRDREKAEDYARRHGVPRVHDDRRGAHSRSRGQRGLHRHAALEPLRARAAGGRRGQAVPGREADGDDARRVRADERRLPRGRRSALRGLLPPGAPALPRGAAAAGLRRHRPRRPTCTCASPSRSPQATRRPAGGSTRRSRARGCFSTSPRTASTCSTSCSGRSRRRRASPSTPAAPTRPRTSRPAPSGSSAAWPARASGTSTPIAPRTGWCSPGRAAQLHDARCSPTATSSCARAASEEVLPIRNPPHVHQPLIQTIVDELRGRGRCESTGESGARATWVMDRLLERYRAGQKPEAGSQK